METKGIIARKKTFKEKLFEKYKDTEISGLDVATLINKSVDKNEKNKIIIPQSLPWSPISLPYLSQV